MQSDIVSQKILQTAPWGLHYGETLKAILWPNYLPSRLFFFQLKIKFAVMKDSILFQDYGAWMLHDMMNKSK